MNNEFPRTLTKNNIDGAINKYHEMLKDIPLNISSDNLLELLRKLKREKINKGPYPNVIIFESANRIMTDLVILFGVKHLLDKNIAEIDFEEFKVELGNENKNNHDIIAEKNGKSLIGEAFNVAPSFFQGKKTTMLKKLRNNKSNSDILLLMYNSDAVSENYKPKNKENEIYLAVDIIIES